MGRYMKTIQLYLIAIAIAGCAKGGMTSSARNKNIVQDNSPVQSLPIEETIEPTTETNPPVEQTPVVTTTEATAPTAEPKKESEPSPTKTEPTTVNTNPFEDPNSPPCSPVPGLLTPWEAPTQKTPTTKKPTTTTPTKPAKPATEQPKENELGFIPLIWEKTVKASKEWSNMIYSIIKTEEPILMGQNIAQDIEMFCPTYRKLNDTQRLNFWGQFFAAVAYYESRWVHTDRYVESTMGIDPVTKSTVVSEGLLSLSYQDQKNYPFHCGFDWSKDSQLEHKDPKKTILNPYLNLRCGIKIMAYQLKKHGRIALEKNVYWSVLRSNGKRLPQIVKMTRSLKICQ